MNGLPPQCTNTLKTDTIVALSFVSERANNIFSFGFLVPIAKTLMLILTCCMANMYASKISKTKTFSWNIASFDYRICINGRRSLAQTRMKANSGLWRTGILLIFITSKNPEILWVLYNSIIAKSSLKWHNSCTFFCSTFKYPVIAKNKISGLSWNFGPIRTQLGPLNTQLQQGEL